MHFYAFVNIKHFTYWDCQWYLFLHPRSHTKLRFIPKTRNRSDSISSISHKTQMWLCGMLISFSVHFFVSPIEWNILLSRPRRSLWKMTTWESGINGLVQCIFDKKECDARNHKHLLLALVRMVHVEKNTTGDPIRNSTFFSINAIAWTEATRLLISSKIEASFMLPFVISPPSLLSNCCLVRPYHSWSKPDIWH